MVVIVCNQKNLQGKSQALLLVCYKSLYTSTDEKGNIQIIQINTLGGN